MSELFGRAGHARVALLTVIPQEFAAVQTHFGATTEVGLTGAYSIPEPLELREGLPILPFALMQCADRSNSPAQGSARNMLELFRPEHLILVGIAGGISRDHESPKCGDVFVSNYVHYAPYAKDLPTGRKQRYFPIQPPSINLVAHARAISNDPLNDWTAGIQGVAPSADLVPRVHIGETIAVEAVAGNPGAEEQKAWVELFDHAGAVDMESGGVGRALAEFGDQVHYSPQWTAVRGISDLVFGDSVPNQGDNNAERVAWKDYAAEAAAVFAKNLVRRLIARERESYDGDPGVREWSFNGGETDASVG